MITTRLNHWLRRKFLSSPRGQRGERRVRNRLRLEHLEDRCVPATLTWTCGFIHLDNNWSDGANWGGLGSRAPADGDDLVFPEGFLSPDSHNDMVDLKVHSITFSGKGAGSNYQITGNSFILESDSSGAAEISADTGLVPRINNAIELAGDSAKVLSAASDATLQVFGVISGTGGIKKTGSGTVVLDRANSYTGRTTVSAGILVAEDASALGATGATNDTVVAAGAQLGVNIASGSVDETLSISGAFSVSTGEGALDGIRGTWSGTIGLSTSDAAISVNANKTFTVSGRITGPGSLTKLGTGTLRLTGTVANDFVGFTFVSAGTLELNKTDVLAVPANLTIGNTNGSAAADTVRLLRTNQIADTRLVTVRKSGVFDLNGFTERIGSLTMVGGFIHSVSDQPGRLLLNGNVTATQDNVGNPARIDSTIVLDLGGAARTFTVNAGPDPDNADLVIDSQIRGGTGQLVKQGTGKLRVNGGSGYVGTTTVSAGELVLASDFGSSPFVVTGGTLSGEGKIGGLTANGGDLRTGVLTVAGNITLNSGTTLHSTVSHPNGSLSFNQLTAVRPRIDVPVTVQLNNPTLLLDNPTGSRPGETWFLLENTGPDPGHDATSGFVRVRGQPIDGTTDSVEFRAFQFTPDGTKTLTITYQGGDGNDVTLTDNTAAAQNLVVTPDVIDEGQQVTLTGTLVGAKPAGNLFLLIIWGDGSDPELHNPGREAFQFTHTYANNPPGQRGGGAYTLTAFWFDEFGFGNRQTREVIVNNVAPTVFTGEDVTLAKGDTVTRSGSVSDPGADTWTATVDYGDGGGPAPLSLNADMTFNLAHAYTAAGTYHVIVAVQDSDGDTGTGSFTVTVTDSGGGANPTPPRRHGGAPTDNFFALSAQPGDTFGYPQSWIPEEQRRLESLLPASRGDVSLDNFFRRIGSAVHDGQPVGTQAGIRKQIPQKIGETAGSQLAIPDLSMLQTPLSRFRTDRPAP
jgi:autotransporter-associated beta strand protein